MYEKIIVFYETYPDDANLIIGLIIGIVTILLFNLLWRIKVLKMKEVTALSIGGTVGIILGGIYTTIADKRSPSVMIGWVIAAGYMYYIGSKYGKIAAERRDARREKKKRKKQERERKKFE